MEESIFLTSDYTAAAEAAKLLQSCPTLCDPIDGSPPGSTIPGILQARTLDWVQIILQSYSYQDSMVLTQKQKYRPMEQDRKSRNKLMHFWVRYF